MKSIVRLITLFIVCLLLPIHIHTIHSTPDNNHAPYTIVFIHLGTTIPPHLHDSLFQARLFNKNCSLVLLAHQQALASFPIDENIEVTTIAVETISQTKEHSHFRQTSTLDRGKPNNVWEGFWFYASERFLYLYDFIKQYNLSNIVHVESDNLLYVDFTTIMPLLEHNYPSIGAVFTHDDRVIPSIVYLQNTTAAHVLAEVFATEADKGLNDMELLALFRRHYPTMIASLPLIMPDYTTRYPLENKCGMKANESSSFYTNNSEYFHAIFDGAALGQYLGGTDPKNWGKNDEGPGFISPYCVIDPSRLSFTWEYDTEKRLVPFASCGGSKYRINNLHIHSKRLKPFLSVKRPPIKHNYICGSKFKALAQHCVEHNTHNFTSEHVNPRDIIYVEGDSLPYFFSTVFPFIRNPFILISHNSDMPAPGNFAAYLDDPRILMWFGQNCDIPPHKKFTHIPIGIANEPWEHGNPKVFDYILHRLEQITYHPQSKLMYINFAPATNPVRGKLITYFKEKKDLAFIARKKSPQDFLWELSCFRYILSPWGNGLDCHRTWESLLVGTIPVVKTSTLDPLYKDLPVIIVQDWNEITPEYLEDAYQKIKLIPFKREKCFMNYWEQLIQTFQKG